MDPIQQEQPTGSWFERRSKNKWFQHINKHGLSGALPAHTVFGAKRAGYQWTNKLITAIAIFCVAFVVAVALGYVFLPGGAFLVFCYQQAKPPRVIAVSADEVSLISLTIISGKPKERIACSPIGQVAIIGPKAVHIGHETVEMKNPECAAFARAIAPSFSAAPPPPPPMANAAPIS